MDSTGSQRARLLQKTSYLIFEASTNYRGKMQYDHVEKTLSAFLLFLRDKAPEAHVEIGDILKELSDNVLLKAREKAAETKQALCKKSLEYINTAMCQPGVPDETVSGADFLLKQCLLLKWEEYLKQSKNWAQ